MTNIGQCHLEFLKDRDGILRAKTEVFEHMLIITTAVTSTMPQSPAMPPTIINMNLSTIIGNLEYLDNNGKGKEIVRLCHEIKALENENDVLYGNYISKLFNNNYSLTEIIKRKDLVQVLENTTNSVKYISDKIRSIISKL